MIRFVVSRQSIAFLMMTNRFSLDDIKLDSMQN